MKNPDNITYPLIPQTRKEIACIFGRIETRIRDNGKLTVINDFRRNIIRVDLPIVGKRWVHKRLAEAFIDVLQEIEYYQDYHGERIKTFGTYNVRYIRGTRRLSFHSWGIACDINARENRIGKPGKIDGNSFIVHAFKRYGFSWGGEWRRPDPMHFEYFCRDY